MTLETYDARWYWCDLTDGYELDELVEPDWSRVPEDRRERVRENWRRGQEKMLQPQRVQLWGPQIPFYLRLPKYRVSVIGVAV